MNSKLKEIILKKLYSDLSHVEIILHTDGSIWFINRDEKYWFLEFEKSGKLWWRYNFFSDFFKLFSLGRVEYEPLIMEWVEDVLNRKVVSSTASGTSGAPMVEDVLNRKVVSSCWNHLSILPEVEDVLNNNI